jgi:multicomponent Na+:H+ antiporter subunit G
MTDAAGYIAGILILAGSLFSALAALGLLRLPDLYTRLHAASKAGVVGAGLIFAAVAVSSGELPVLVRAIFGILFLLLTTPVSAHLLARAAFLAGFRPIDITIPNDIDKIGNNVPQ